MRRILSERGLIAKADGMNSWAKIAHGGRVQGLAGHPLKYPTAGRARLSQRAGLVFGCRGGAVRTPRPTTSLRRRRGEELQTTWIAKRGMRSSDRDASRSHLRRWGRAALPRGRWLPLPSSD